jgi:hypothetical protein
MLAVVNHVYLIRQSCCSRMSITIHACTTFPIEDGAFSLVFLYERPTSSQGAAVDGDVH